jgi:site-specific recombinase XerC
VRNLARHLADQRPQLTGWEQVTRSDIDAYMATVRTARSYLGDLLAFFSWARQRRRILADPTRGLRRQHPTGYRGRVLSAADQRQLLLRWTTKACHPNEAAIGLLALVHAASVSELRQLTVDDLDHAAHSIRLGRRPHSLPLDPLTWEALTDALNHRAQVGATNPHLFVTTQTVRRHQPMSTTYLHTLFGPLGTGPRELRSTRLTALAVELDPRLLSVVAGMAEVRNALRYRADYADEARLTRR